MARLVDSPLDLSNEPRMYEVMAVERSRRLNERPTLPMLGARAAKQIERLIAQNGLRRLEDGPVGEPPSRSETT